MLANLILSFNVVVPLFLEMLLGFFLRRIGLLDEHTTSSLNKLIFKCFLPILIFSNIYHTDTGAITDLSYMLIAVIGLLVIFAVLMVVMPRIEKDKRKCGVLVQAGFRSNFVLFGIPVVSQLLGEEHTGSAALLVAVLIPMYNVLAVVTLEYFRGQSMDVRKVLKGIMTNVMIIGATLGILFNVSGLRLPSSIVSTVTGVSRIATPLALIVLGADFRLDAIKEYRKQLSLGLFIRLILVPVIMMTVAGLMGMRDEKFVALMVAFGAPVAVSSYTMAEMMDGDGVLASQLVFYSTGLCIFTLFVLIFVTKSLGMF